jgi:hypothetical protein
MQYANMSDTAHSTSQEIFTTFYNFWVLVYSSIKKTSSLPISKSIFSILKTVLFSANLVCVIDANTVYSSYLPVCR